jgi:hypothetical protein
MPSETKRYYEKIYQMLILNKEILAEKENKSISSKNSETRWLLNFIVFFLSSFSLPRFHHEMFNSISTGQMIIKLINQ